MIEHCRLLKSVGMIESLLFTSYQLWVNHNDFLKLARISQQFRRRQVQSFCQ